MPSEAASPTAALVTGGSRGIGRAVADALAASGRRVAIAARTTAEVETAARAIGAIPLVADVTDAGSVARAVEAAEGAIGAIGLLVNAAGIAESAPYARTDGALLRRHLDVNLLGAHHAVSRVLPGMLERREGTIVNVASIAGLAGFAYASAYAASKHALVGLTRSIAAEIAGSGVRVNAVCPGFVDTPLLARSVEAIASKTGRTREEARASLAAMNPSGRLIEPSEVAEAVAWLAGPAGADLNGEAIVVDGVGRPWDAGAGLPVHPASLGEARGYSHGILLGAGRRLFVAGQIAWDAERRIVGGDDFAAQFDAALGNVLAVVTAAGGRADRIGRLRIYVADRDRYLASLKEVGRAYRRRMGAHYPAMALVEVARLLEPGALVEIEAEAVL